MTKDSEIFSSWFHSVWRITGPIIWHAAAVGCMKVQTYGDTSSVRIRAQRRSVTKTQSNLVCLGFSKPHSEEGRKALIVFLVVIEGVLETLVGSSRTLIEPNRSYRRLTRPNSFGIRSGCSRGLDRSKQRQICPRSQHATALENESRRPLETVTRCLGVEGKGKQNPKSTKVCVWGKVRSISLIFELQLFSPRKFTIE
jgi:hypothetical protein